MAKETDDLINRLNQATEEIADQGDDFTPEGDTPEGDTADGLGNGFDADGNQIMTGADDFDAEEPEETADDQIQEPDRPPMGANEAKVSARWYIKAFNLVQKTILKPIYRSRLLQEGDIEKVREASKRAKEAGAKHIQDLYAEGDPMYDVCARFDRYLDAVNDLPLTKDEQSELLEPLAAVIEKYRWMQMGPEGQLLLAVFVIMAPRLEPALPGIGDKLKEVANG